MPKIPSDRKFQGFNPLAVSLGLLSLDNSDYRVTMVEVDGNKIDISAIKKVPPKEIFLNFTYL